MADFNGKFESNPDFLPSCDRLGACDRLVVVPIRF